VPASPYVISLDDAGRAELEAVSRRGTAPFRLVLRARIVLLAAAGLGNRAVSARLGVCEDTARKWRRYCQDGLAGLADAPRPGRPRKFPARGVAEVKALACELPAASGKPLASWTCPELARQSAAAGIVASVSASTVRRWLDDDAIKPWQRRIAGRERVRPLRHPGLPGRLRCPPCPRLRPVRAVHGDKAVHRAGRPGHDRRALRLSQAGLLGGQQRGLAPQLGRRRAPARRLPQRADGPPARPCLLAQPGQVYFSVIQRKLLTPDDFGDLDGLAEQILAFERHYNATARPFDWRFTRTDLNHLLTRISRHDPFAPRPLAA
jgi:transposase